jgi:hypothetical protein
MAMKQPILPLKSMIHFFNNLQHSTAKELLEKTSEITTNKRAKLSFR